MQFSSGQIMFKRKIPEVRCVNVKPSTWKFQCQDFEKNLINQSTTVIFSIKDLVSSDPIAGMNFLQKINSCLKVNPSHQIVALNKDMLLITPHILHMAE